MHEAVIASEKKDGILFITDILGGSTFQIAAKIGQLYPRTEILCGANLSLLLEVCSNRDEHSIEAIRDLAIEWGQESITSLYHQTKSHVFDGEKHHVDGI